MVTTLRGGAVAREAIRTRLAASAGIGVATAGVLLHGALSAGLKTCWGPQLVVPARTGCGVAVPLIFVPSGMIASRPGSGLGLGDSVCPGLSAAAARL